MDGTLYVVATPIGNLDEMSPRAIAVLKSVKMIACEDTRETLKLCNRFDIDTPLMSCHEHNEYFVADKIVEILKRGDDVALVSDAGYPGISDPGNVVVNRCIEHRIKVAVVSGPCALINGLVGSGKDAQHFLFYGFLDHKQGERKKELIELTKIKNTIIFYEAPHRIDESLEDMLEILGDRQIVIARELTKKFEEYLRGSISEIMTKIKAKPIKGEMVIVVEGAKPEPAISYSDVEVLEMVNSYIQQGMSTSDAIKEVASVTKIKKNEIYHKFHQN